jgi:response regulator of citrate/malate metabolism
MLSHVIIIEDEPSLVALFRRVIRHYNADLHILSAGNGADGLNLIAENAQHNPLVLLDLSMPVMNGFQVLDHLLNTGMYPIGRVVILTTSDHVEDAVRAKSFGVGAYLIKPVEASLLREVLDHYSN